MYKVVKRKKPEMPCRDFLVKKFVRATK